jgi:hypothetical protein
MDPFDVFEPFRKDSGIVYPPFSQIYFEKYFYNYMKTRPDPRYIPVFWTENQIPAYTREMHEARQKAINTLPNDRLYFTVVQHDNGIMGTQLPKTVVFGLGGQGHIPLPLNYENPELFKQYRDTPKTLFCSFTGSLTHPCRIQAIKQLHSKPDVVLTVHAWTDKIPEGNQKAFLETMSKSRFTLAPRGYGKSSFRMYEAMELGSVPVYVYDDLWLPYTELLDWKKMAVLVHVSDLPTLYETLLKITDKEVEAMLAYYQEHRHLFTFEGMSEYILAKMATIHS